jgi:hypothetical protein
MRIPVHVQPLLVNALLAPVVGLALVRGRAEGIVSRDFLGIPFIAYAFIGTIVPVLALSAVANRLCALFRKRGYSSWAWYAVGLIAGAGGGALVGRAFAGFFLGGRWRFLLAGALTGAMCGVIHVLLCRKGERYVADLPAA